jgi:hypothetical protein
MEIFGSYTTGTVSTDLVSITIPSGYNISLGVDAIQYGPQLGRFTSNETILNSRYLYFQATETDKVYITEQSAARAPTTRLQGSQASTSTTVCDFWGSFPIQGWNSNFNPLLSMPLVKRGNDYEFCQFDGGGDEASSNTAIPYFTTETVSTIDQMGTVQNSTSLGWSFTASKRVFVDMTYSVWEGGDTNIFCGISINATGTMLTTSAEGVNNTNPEVIIAYSQNFRGTSGSLPCTVSASGILLNPGDIIRPHGYAQGEANGNAKLHMSVREDVGNTDMAHIIKPAVAVIKQVKGKGSDGGNITSFTYVDRECNVFEGETWFVTPGTGTLGSGGTCVTFTLEAGTYEASIEGCARECNTNFLRLLNNTDSTTTIQGRNSFSDSTTNNAMPVSSAKGVFTITSAKEFKIQHYAQTTKSASGQGLGIGTGSTNNPDTSIHMEAVFRKLK